MQTVSTQNPSTEKDANKAAISTPKDIDIVSIVGRNAKRDSKSGTVREQFMCNRSKLFAATCAEVKSLLGMDKQARLDAAMASKVDEAIDKFLMERINTVTPQNIVSNVKTFRHDARNMAVVERVTVRGVNIITLKEQNFGIMMLIKQQEKRLTTLQAKATPDYEAETNCKTSIARLELTQNHINAQIAQLQKTDKSVNEQK